MSSSTSHAVTIVEYTTSGKKNQPVIRYPKMVEYSKLFTTDQYWMSIFQDLAHGVCPRQYVTIDDKKIYINKKQKQQTILEYANVSDTKAAYQIKQLFIKECNLGSEKDNIEHEKHIEQIIVQNESSRKEHTNVFNKTRPRKEREALLIDFVTRTHEQLMLEHQHKHEHNKRPFDPQSARLYELLKGAFEMGTHSNSDVKFENGRIIGIDGISTYPPCNLRLNNFDICLQIEEGKSKNKSYNANADTTKTTKTSKKKVSKKTENKKNEPKKIDLCIEWNKYINSLYKKSSNYQVSKTTIIDMSKVDDEQDDDDGNDDNKLNDGEENGYDSQEEQDDEDENKMQDIE